MSDATVARTMKSFRWFFSSCFLLSMSSCAQGSAAPPATITSASMSAPAAGAAHELPLEGRAHTLVLQATSCWLGGLWSDAAGDERAARDAAIAHRCTPILRAVGESSASTYYALRAVDPATVEKVAERIGKTAQEDAGDPSRAAALVAFFREVASASRETVLARRAADSVKEAYQSSASLDERRADKNAAAPALRSSTALRALLEDAGPYALEARVIGTLHAIDRMEIARGLPKHLKILCVEGMALTIFGVTAPQVSSDAAAPIPTGTWLAYLSSMASAAHHPVPDDARDPQNREPLAWNGVLEGLADQLRDVRTHTRLDTVSRNVVERLDRQAASARAAFDAHPPAAR